jgi:hypothetical protein
LLLRTYNTLKWFYDEYRHERDRGMNLLMNIIPMMSEQGGFLSAQREEPLAMVANNDGTVKRERKGKKTA